MQLDRLALHLRRRSPMEAIDLGCAMARTWWRPVLAAWLPLYLGATVLVHLLLFGSPVAAILVLWWLKPLFDRAVLEVLGRGVFGEHPGVLETLKAVWKSPGLLSSLTLYRFDLARSFNLPIWHLERLSGAAASRRARALHGRSRPIAATIVFLHFEQLVVMLALLGAIDLFTPQSLDAEFGLKTLLDGDKAPWQQALYAAFYAIAVTLIEPFYVAAGFALYLNRRTQLEAWDVELALRRYGRRERAAPVAAMLLLAIVVGVGQPDVARAATGDPGTTIKEVLSDPVFEQYRDEKRWRRIDRAESDQSARQGRERSAETGAGIGSFAEILRLLAWVGLAAVLAFALYHLRRIVPGWIAAPPAPRTPPAAIFGLEIAPESLPPDVAAAALAALDEGNVRGGLSLLYRGALSALVHRDGLEVAAGDTEGECVRRVATHGEAARARYFGDLVRAWQVAAYAGRLPPDAFVRALCRDWTAHFGREGA